MRAALRILAVSCATALRHPHIVLTCWLVVTAVALVVVAPAVAALDRALAHHPAAGRLLDLTLDGDFARTHPEAAVRAGGACLVVGALFAWLAGGILVVVGRRRPARLRDVLAEGGRLFLVNLRVLAVTGAVLLIVHGAFDVLSRWMREDWLYDVEPGSVPLPLVHDGVLAGLEAFDWLEGLVFLVVVFVGKMALARLAVGGGRSAVVAWCVALGRALLRPVRTLTLVGVLALAWLGVGHVLGEATVRALEVKQRLWIGLAAGQLGIVWTQVVFVTALLAARTAMEDPAPPLRPPDTRTDPEASLESAS